MKHLFKLVLCMCLFQYAFAQKHFQVTINLDTSIIPKRIVYHYEDGQKVVSLIDSNKSASVTFKGEYHAIYANLNVSYYDKTGAFYHNTFFINEKPAKIDLYYSANPYQLLLHRRLVNAIAFYDTTTNKVYREIIRDSKKNNVATKVFYEKYNDQLDGSDSLRKVIAQLVKADERRAMQILRKYPDDYSSFWYFQYQLSAVRSAKPDTAYLKEKLAFFNSAFPAKFTQSSEGKDLIQAFERKLTPIKLNATAPAFTITTIDGKNISLNNLKGKYILLDFWATWCAPCMKEMPFIRSLTVKYPPNKLVIIGISRDYDLATLKKTIKKEGMSWIQFFDNETKISRLYGVNEFPTLILLNKESKIIYRSEALKDDAKELPKILNENIGNY